MKPPYGLTVIEFALLLAIMASTAMMVIPLFESSYKGAAVEDEAYKLESFVCSARDKAMLNGKEHRIYFNPAANSFEVFSTELDKEKQAFTLHLDAGIRIRMADSGKKVVSFNEQGIPSREVEIELNDGREKAFTVKVASQSGNITVVRKY